MKTSILGNFHSFYIFFSITKLFYAGASEKADTDYSPAMSGLKDVTNAPEFHSFFNDDDFGFPRHSTMTRW